MKINEQSLREKGWSEEEIAHAQKIVGKAHENKQPTHKHLEKAMYWFLFIIIIGIGIGGAFLIEPFLLYLKPAGAHILIGIVGLVFGTFAGIVVKDIEDLEKHHHLAVSVIIPIVAIISSIIMSKQVRTAAQEIGRTVELHPFALAVVSSICILLPYGIFIWLEEKKRK
ncbi:hypothetical protein JXA48_04765 [Candidatus Woesearchaeota archaeon]|nr:hypothetical protein [Candidatus Woesearchaeota archaeon]